MDLEGKWFIISSNFIMHLLCVEHFLGGYNQNKVPASYLRKLNRWQIHKELYDLILEWSDIRGEGVTGGIMLI